MIEIVSREEPKWDDIPLGLRDLPLYGYFLDPEALIAGKERFLPSTGGYNYVFRTLSEEDTESYNFFTEILIGKDSMFSQSHKNQKNLTLFSCSA
jgi:hypothetical protein